MNIKPVNTIGYTLEKFSEGNGIMIEKAGSAGVEFQKNLICINSGFNLLKL